MAANRFIASLLICVAFIAVGGSSSQADEVGDYLKRHCVDCHGATKPPAGISLVGMKPVSNSNAKTWQRILAQIATGEMPPRDQPKPDIRKREAVIAALSKALKNAGIDSAAPNGSQPAEGNLIDHDRLFSGHHTGPASSPPRFWRRSQPQYDRLMERLWVIPRLRYEKAGHRLDPKWAGFSYSRPFPQMDPKQFSNYAKGVHADEAVLRALMDAGGQIAERLTTDSPAYAKELQPPVAVGVPSIRRNSTFRKFLVKPPKRPAEFEPFIQSKKTPTAKQQRAAVRRVFRLFLNREPNNGEAIRYGGLLKRSVEKRGALSALRGLITAVIVSPEFVLRMEIGLGTQDKHGRRMLSSSELAYAVPHALTDSGPDAGIWQAMRAGKLKTKADVEREVRRILSDDKIEKHRILRFFQEFFGYHQAGAVFKDKGGWQHEVKYLVRDADMLVEHILKKDRNVFAELLTTDRYFVAYPNIKDPKLFAAVIQRTIDLTKQQIAKSKQRKRKIRPPRKGGYSRAWSYLQGRRLIPRTVHNDRGSAEMSYIKVYGFDGATFEWSPKQPIKVPGRRAGLLTHPAWLVAHSSNFDNDIVGRGHWIREKLLAGKIPDVPIDVEAQVPDEPNHTLRHRMRVTKAERCIRCHRRMDPLGYPFEMYDHYGLYRTRERVGSNKKRGRGKLLPIDATGAILVSGDTKLDGKVKDAIDLVHRLAKSPRVRQSIIRHAFRYWMGRNETLADSPTLIAADQAYVKSGGSFREVLVSLLTSDSFLYRK